MSRMHLDCPSCRHLCGYETYTAMGETESRLVGPDCARCKNERVISFDPRALLEENERLRAETESMASQSIADHIEYKNRRNQQFAAYELAHRATIAYLIDRAEQYTNSSGYRAFVEELIADIAVHRHVTCAEAGEYDDLMPRVKKIIASRVAEYGEKLRRGR